MKEMLEQVLRELGGKRIVFLSEADFQFTLAWKIKEMFGKKFNVILEYPDEDKEKQRRIYYDIYVCEEGGKAEEGHLIELKYNTKKWKIYRHGNEIPLRNQAAHIVGRYQFFADIARLEKQEIVKGQNYCIMLTNDSLYYAGPKKQDKTAKLFYIHDGEKINAGIEPIPDEKRKYLPKDIEIKYSYQCKWQNYCPLGDGDKTTEFKYLLLEIPPQKPAE